MPYELKREYEFDIERALEQTWELEEEFAVDDRPGSRQLFQVSRFPRYSRSAAAPPPLERAKIDRIASIVAHGLRSGQQAIRTIRLIGHADMDTPRRLAFERQIALARAREVGAALSLSLDRLDGSGRRRPVPP